MAKSTPTNVEIQAFVVIETNAEFVLKDIVLDGVRDDDLLIEMKYSGICHLDLLVQSGILGSTFKFPAILGHEGAGYVRAIGCGVKQDDISIGDFILLAPPFCRKCKQCMRGHPAYCCQASQYHSVVTRVSDGSSPPRMKDGRAVTSHSLGSSSFAKMNMVHKSRVVKYPYKPETATKFAACG